MKITSCLSIQVLALAIVFPSFAFGSGSSGRCWMDNLALTAAIGQTNAPAPETPAAPSTPTPGDEPDHGLAAANHIKALLRDHQMDQALAAARRETENHPGVAVTWYSLGDVLLQLHRPQEALPALQKAIELNPKIGPALFEMGICQAAQHQSDQAIETLSRAIDRMPDYLPAWIELYQCYGQKHDPLGAENKFQGYVKANPKSPYAWYMLGQIQMHEQLPTSAIDSWQKAVDLKPDFPDALKYLGLAYARAQQLDKAIDCFARAASLRPDAELLNNLGYTYLIMGQTDKAIETLKQALKLDPKYTKSLYNLTNAYAKEQQWALAKETCRMLAATDPQSAADLSRKFPASGVNEVPAQPETPAPSPALVSSPTPPQASTNLVVTPSSSSVPIQITASAPASAATVAPLATSAPASATTPPQDQVPPQTPTPTANPAPAPVTMQTPASAPLPTIAPVQVTTQTPFQAAMPSSIQTPATTPKGTAVGYDTGPPASWVKPLDPDAIPLPASAEGAGGVDYLLIDNQQIMDPTAWFSHYTLRLTNEEGLQNGSDIRAEFDPNYQTLTLHWLKVKRDGVWQDRLGTENFQVLRREQNLDSQMLDGRYSVICHLQDIRVGDLVDFAFTVKGANPVFGGKFIDSFLMTFLRSVHLFSNQLTTAPNRMVFLKSFGGAPEPVRTRAADQTELITWTQKEAPATQLEPRTSRWYDTFGGVQVTEFTSWKDVVDWGLATFSLKDPLSQALGDKIAEIAMAHKSPEERALAVINFVQNDIRYLGIEMGANSYKPASASLVFEHRFGDCKDKAQLCVVMLRALGIEAYPALVSTSRGAETDKLLPSPLDFDHAIVQLTVDGQSCWIDTTRSNQRGRLRDFYVDDFKRALLLKPGADALVPVTVSRASMPRIAVEETFTVKSTTDPVSLLIHTVFEGRSAESIRTSVNFSSHEEMEKAYLNYYARSYAQIKVGKPLRFQDFPDDNRFEMWQNYTIANLWTRDTPASQWKATFMPYSILDAVGGTTSAQRTTPYRLDYPADISEDMEIQMFHKWRLDTTPTQIDNPNFVFTEIPSLDDNIIHFKYHFQTLAADVPPAGIGEYNDQISRIREHLECILTYQPGMNGGTPGIYRPNWFALAIIGLVLGICGYGAYRIYSIQPADGRSGIPYGLEHYEGIGGWLILILIGLALAILANARTLGLDLDLALNLTKWKIFTVPGASRYDPLWAPTLLFEAISCIVLLSLSFLAIVLLFQKRFTFPGVMIAILVTNLLYHLIDHVLASQISALAGHGQLLAPNLFPMMIGCAIWIPYFLVSKRVKATFRY